MRKVFFYVLLALTVISCKEDESQALHTSFEFSTEQLKQGENELIADDMLPYELFEQGTMRDSISLTAIYLKSLSFTPDPSWLDVVFNYKLYLKRPDGSELQILDKKGSGVDVIEQTFESSSLDLKRWLEHDDASLVLYMNSYKNMKSFGRGRLRFDLDVAFEEAEY